MKPRPSVFALVLFCCGGLSAARAQPIPKDSATIHSNTKPISTSSLKAWSDPFHRIGADIRAGNPFVVHITVPLCSNDQINCGAPWAGKPDGLNKNVYWGAVFGARRFFDRKQSGWERVELQNGPDEHLERVIYRRFVSAPLWGLEASKRVEQLVVLQAIHGDQIDRAVLKFWKIASEGGTISFREKDQERAVSIHVAGYAGHNRLMDGLKLPVLSKEQHPKSAIPSFVMACHSDSYFSASLEKAGSAHLIATRALMAPEGYIIDAITKALGDNKSEKELRDETVRAYAKFQRISFQEAGAIFRPAKSAHTSN